MEIEKVIIGQLGSARGLKGELKLIPLTDFEERFEKLKQVEVDSKILKVDYVKEVSNNLVIKFEGYDTRELAKKLTNKFMKVNRSEVAELGEGEYYTFDIIGLKVQNQNGESIGEVREVLKTGSNDVYVVKSVDNEIMIPALKRVVKKIDIESKIMIIDEREIEEI